MFFISAVLLLLTTYLFLGLKGKGMYFDYFSIIYYFYLVFGVVGALAIYFGLVDETYFVQPFADSIYVKEYGLLAVSYGIFGIFLSFYIFKVALRKKMALVWSSYTSKDVGCTRGLSVEFIYFTIILILSTSYYLVYIHPSPLYMALIGNEAVEVAIRRIEVTRFFPGIGIVKTLALVSSQIFILYSYVIFLHRKNTFTFILSCCWCFFVLLSSGEKSNLLITLLGLLVVYSYVVGRIKIKYIIFAMLGLWLLILLVYLVFMVQGSLLETAYLMFERIFIAQTIAPFLSIEYYQEHPFVFFNSMESYVFNIFNERQELRSSEVFMSYYYPGMVEQGGWNVNGIYIHEAYSNFGLLGVIFAPLYIGLINFIFCMFFLKIKKTALSVSLFSYFSINVISILTSFNSQILNTQTILIIVVFFPVLIVNSGIGNKANNLSGDRSN